MFLVRDLFHAKPGKAKELVRMFKNMTEEMQKSGMKIQILTDASSTYWTVVIESEVEDLNSYLNMSHNVSETTKEKKSSKDTGDYRDLVIDGYREIFRVE